MTTFPDITTLPAGVSIERDDYTRWNGDTATAWRILRDGELDSYLYDTADYARVVALKEATAAAAEQAIEEALGGTYHYGIRVWSEPNPREGGSPIWLRTDPHAGIEAYRFAWYSDSPPPMDVYTRQQYEAACAAVGLTPAPDGDLGTYADKYFAEDLGRSEQTARVAIEVRLRRRRLAGLIRERAAAAADEPAVARTTVASTSRSAGPCDECGTDMSAEQVMVASLGRACGPDCYDAMADRPGRYASRSGSTIR